MIRGTVRKCNIPIVEIRVPSESIVIVSLHMSVITQWGESPLMMAARNGRTEVVPLLVKAGAALDLQDQVNMWH